MVRQRGAQKAMPNFFFNFKSRVVTCNNELLLMWRWGREMEEKMPGQGGHGWNERIVRRTSTCVRDSSRWRGELWASSYGLYGVSQDTGVDC